MLYRKMKKNGDELSILGYGCMRYPTKNGSIDYKRTEKQVMTAIEKGVNYFDTAYLYPGSEKTLGKILKNNDCREKVKIADKMPVLTAKNREKIDEIFEKQLNRLQTNYIDYYMIHNLIKFEDWETLKKNGILNFLDEEKKKGRIINIGFSFHGNLHNFKKIIDDYDWEFTLIQYNYIDENYQIHQNIISNDPRALEEFEVAKVAALTYLEHLKGHTNEMEETLDGKKRI